MGEDSTPPDGGRVLEGISMSKAAKPAERAQTSASVRDSQDGDVLHFLARTLQAHTLDAKPQDVLAKLQNLRDALAEQESTLAHWPESASKTRICAALAKAKAQVSQIVDEFEDSERVSIRGAKAS
jgi:hypothetical protein